MPFFLAAAAIGGASAFYTKGVDAGGIPIVGSARVPDAALRTGSEIVRAMLAGRPDIRRDMARQRVRVAMLARQEGIMDLPEHRHWQKPRPDDPRLTQCERDEYQVRIAPLSHSAYWNARARGIGGTLTAVGAENVLAEPGTRYFGENILVHEFAHPILASIQRVDPKLYAEVERAYSVAITAGKWKGDYAAVTVQEYWAEGTQFWFNSNMISRLDDGTILSHEDLRRYDPALYKALGKVYGPRHRIVADRFHKHAARLNVAPGRKSADC
ncbi:MAG TPA: glycoside hydrolase [Allosphingosinicella sp.]|uniref:glycoside hydrolase n=1 Tax=Allosphingosinicella sp. TaxID=2823234 RepID=UPI002ED99268